MLGRVLFKLLEEKVNKSELYGFDKSEVSKVEVLDWGTLVDGTPFNAPDSNIAYIKSDLKAINVGDNKWLADRGHILGVE